MVLSLTLVAVIWYGYDTNAIARVTLERWERDGVLSTTYEMVLTHDAKIGDAGHTLVRLHNPSRLVVLARFNGNFRVYGQPVTPGDMYDGQERWLLFPQQMSQGWFEIESLVQQQGKSVSAMRAECTEGNREKQLTMMLELEFQDELGALRKLPPRRHYFDFQR